MLRIAQPPNKFMLPDVDRYPSHQTTPMIEQRAAQYFSHNYRDIDTDLVYVPIQWTAYHRAHHYGQYIADVQYFIEALVQNNPSLKFFTIVQYADGILAKFPNCKIFAAGGHWKPGHAAPRWADVEVKHDVVPIPLLCDPHPIKPLANSTIDVSFAGSLTHPIRQTMIKELGDIPGYQISTSLDSIQAFRDLTYKSKFVLCPRGYGVTSFRLYEIIQMQRIPVYISDDMFLPFAEEIDWNRLALCIGPEDIAKIPKIVKDSISSGDYLRRIEYGKSIFNKYFTFEGCIRNIERIITANYPHSEENK